MTTTFDLASLDDLPGLAAALPGADAAAVEAVL